MRGFLATLSLCAVSLFLLGCSSKRTTSTENDNFGNNVEVTDENTVIDIFLEYAQCDYDGEYRFRKYHEFNDAAFSYCFGYSPSCKTYSCSVLVISYTDSGEFYVMRKFPFLGVILRMAYFMLIMN